MRPNAEHPSEELRDNTRCRLRSDRVSRIINAAYEKTRARRTLCTISPLQKQVHQADLVAVTASDVLSPQETQTYPMSRGATPSWKTGCLNGQTTAVDSRCGRRSAGDGRTAIHRGVLVVVQTPLAHKTELLRPRAVDADRQGGRRRRGTRLSSTTRVAACVPGRWIQICTSGRKKRGDMAEETAAADPGGPRAGPFQNSRALPT